MRTSSGEHDKLQTELHTERKQNKVTSHYIWILKIVKMMLYFTFDLQPNLPVPMLTHGTMFYMSQLWAYNFSIYE